MDGRFLSSCGHPFRALGGVVLFFAQIAYTHQPDVLNNTCNARDCAYRPGEACQCNVECARHHDCCADHDHANCTLTRERVVAAQPAGPPRQVSYGAEANSVVNFDLYRAMSFQNVDSHPLENDDMADIPGVIKYVHTEVIMEHLADPLRTTRKYGIDCFTKHRFKIRNSDSVLKDKAFESLGEFGMFVTYDWGQATNTAQDMVLRKFGDFIGVQAGCFDLHCDVRWLTEVPYAWYSVGNWCPNLPWDKKGTKSRPNPLCLRDANGRVVTGGLCPGGFDSQDTIPATDPTGEPGCVYTHGKADVVMLDQLIGLTDLDCAGGVKCRDWLHFRRNCTDDRYRRQFLPDGSITSTTYCVEYDLHPDCQGECMAPNCQALLAAGKEVELGLSWWRGRCVARANSVRMALVADAFGITGALTEHHIVDEDVLQTNEPCPASQGTAWTCAPFYTGSSGPMCTREFSGACQPCYIPGAASGLDPPPRPWCPLDIFDKYPYSDRLNFPIPACKTRKASDGCCLYSSSCEGTSDPTLAALDDDGLALVASRQSTADMEVFLRRVASATGAISIPTDPDGVWELISYFTWQLGPTNRTLHQALTDASAVRTLGMIGTGPIKITKPATLPAAPPVTVPEFKPAPAPTPVPPTSNVSIHESIPKSKHVPTSSAPRPCLQDDIAWDPEMPGTWPSQERDALACKRRCAETDGCRHFSFLTSLSTCTLHDISATGLALSGLVSGPPKCWHEYEETDDLIDLGGMTYVHSNYSCMDRHKQYATNMLGTSNLAFMGMAQEQAVLLCQRQCQETTGCSRFTFLMSTQQCTLSGPGAQWTFAAGTMSGPPHCNAVNTTDISRLYNRWPVHVHQRVDLLPLCTSLIFFAISGTVITRRLRSSSPSATEPRDDVSRQLLPVK